MKRLIVLLFFICIGAFTSNLSAQENRDTKTQEAKKGGFAVGGFDASRQESAKTVKRSVNMNDEAEVSEKAVMEEAAAPAPPVEAMPAAAPAPVPEKKEGNAYGKEKQKSKKDSKSKGKRK
jgi:hypothetical protein